MKRLYILRHAKSSWAVAGLRDHQRKLNKRGRKQMPLVSAYFQEMGYTPERVFCSTAARTRETCEYLSNALPDAKIEFVDELYNGGSSAYLDAIEKTEDDESVLLIGHNPTCDELARSLASDSDLAWPSLMDSHFGTAALAVFDITAPDWSSISADNAELVDFQRPKALQARAAAG